ncbi:MAG: hypothetical protein ACK5MJ_08830 [Alphaproteobacteria bacterium]
MSRNLIKVIHLAHKLKTTPRNLSDIAYELHIKKWHNDWGEEFFKRRDAKNILKFFYKAEQMEISPLFLLDTYKNAKQTQGEEAWMSSI